MQTKDKIKTFAGQSFYVGIDYHKKSWKVTILGEQYEHKTMSQDPDPAQLVNYLRKHFPEGDYYAVYEAGFSGFGSCRKLRQLGIDCKVIHPADVPSSQKEKLQKTDKADSRKLARVLRGGEFEGIHIPDPILEADRALIRQRFRLVKDIARIKNRVKSLLFQFGIAIPQNLSDCQSRHWSKVYLNWLKGLYIEEKSLKQVLDNYIQTGESLRGQLLKVNRQIRELSRSSAYKDNYELLVSLPGIGLIAGMTILVELGDINRFKRLDDLCNYVGLVPSMHSSGEKTQMGKLIKRGRKGLKIIFIEAAWVGIRKDSALMMKFNELIKTMPKNKAIIRIARKMLSRVRYVLQHQQKYELGVVK